ncbi:uncharacterized protein LOC130695042 [Daphnia carinata]|uniref:uncharacterized protein LOC130695042 n=1 Tax=Daphnia carinata TaxID=120202 RepID=UPI002868DF53|nr:uncharacterized protein LOC130695042 [Daphnia carinata]
MVRDETDILEILGLSSTDFSKLKYRKDEAKKFRNKVGKLQFLQGKSEVSIQEDDDTNIKEKGKSNSLHGLCRSNSSSNFINEIKRLIDLGYNVNDKDKDGKSPLHYLCQYNSSPHFVDAIQLLFQHGIDVNAESDNEKNALHYLCQYNSSPRLIDAIQLFVQHGIDVNAKDNYEKNALHYLCENNSSPHLIDAIQLLVQLGFDVNAKSKYGMNALHYLCQYNSSPKLIDAIQLLVEIGIDVKEKDKDGRNSLHHLCQYNSSWHLIDAMYLLVKLGIDVKEKDKDGWNPLHYLCRYNSSSDLRGAIQILIQHGINVEEKTNDGWNALHFSCQNNSNSNLLEILSILIEKGVDINEKTNRGENAIDILVKNEIDENLKSNVLKFLIRHGIRVHLDNTVSPNVNQYVFKENDNYDGRFLNLLTKKEIRLGWHEQCENCNQILSIERNPRVRLQHHHMFGNCYRVFHFLLKHLETWAKSNQESGESEMDMRNPAEWLRKKAEQYHQSENEITYKENLEVMAEVSEQVKKGSNSRDFNCDNYERYLRSMYSIAEMIDSNESMGQIKWFYLLPFDFPMDYENEKDSEIKRAKIEWDKTLFSWAHSETDTCYGTFMKEDANEGFFLPKQFKHKCHGEL